MKLNEKVAEVLDSGIEPIILKYETARFFDDSPSVVRSHLLVNSLDIGTLEYGQYRFVASRSKQADHLVALQASKLMRAITRSIDSLGKVSCYTIPVYARNLREGLLSKILADCFNRFPKVPPELICVEISADILYEDIEWIGKEIGKIRNMGVKIALNEVGDEFCPIFRLSSVNFDYAILDPETTRLALSDKAESTVKWLVEYLHSKGARVIATDFESEEAINAVCDLDCDGYTAQMSDSVEVI